MTAAPASLTLYAWAGRALSPLAPAWLRARARRGKEDARRWPERLGRGAPPCPPGKLVWLHGVSVGESLSLLPLVDRLRAEPEPPSILVTSGTLTSAELLRRRLPVGVTHQFAPLDLPAAAERFLRHWSPDLAVFVESELWPNLILQARRRGARLALVSARLSERSFAGWRRAPAAARAVLGAFDLILARDSEAGARLTALGAEVRGLADLKFGAPPLPADPAELRRLRAALGDRPVILAASTHPGEEEIVLAAFEAAAAGPEPVLILVPRHPERGEAVQRLAEAGRLTVRRRGLGQDPEGASVYVADTLGELGLWYRLATLALVGGSLVPGAVGGHNPFEPARLNRPFVSGTTVTGWPVYADLVRAGATALVPAEALGPWLARAITDPRSLAPMAEAARAFVAEGDAAAARAVDGVLELLRR